VLRPSEWPRMIVVVGPALVFLAASYAAAEPAIAQTNTPPVETNWSDPASLIGGLFEYQVTFSPFELAPRLVATGILVRFAFQELRARWASGVRTAWPLGAGAEGGIARVVVALVLLYAVVPNAYRGWFYCSTRFLLMAWLLLPALAEIPPRLARRLPPLGAALSVIVLAIQLPDLWRSSRQMQNILDVGKTLPKGAKIIPMDFSPRLLGPKPLGHAWAELVVERDVVASQLFASGKPRMGGERFRTLSFYPGLLDTASGRLPWSSYETWSEVVRDCRDRASAECEKSLKERRSELETVVDRYDYVLMIDPPDYGRELIGEHLTLRSRVGSAWLFEVKKEEGARSASR
jgi:hypothetical protein